MALVLSVKLNPSAASVINPVHGLPSAHQQRLPSGYIDSHTTQTVTQRTNRKQVYASLSDVKSMNRK